MGPVEISIVSDAGPGDWVPAHLVPSGLDCRTAVIQDTFVEGCVDMHFDEPLWRGLVDYVVRFDPQAEVSVVPAFGTVAAALPPPMELAVLCRRLTGQSAAPSPAWPPAFKGEVPLAAFLADWDALPTEDREPPAVLLGRRDGRVVLCVITEAWNLIGGRSATYHDSYTWSFFADRDLADDLKAFLAALPDADRRRIIPARPA